MPNQPEHNTPPAPRSPQACPPPARASVAWRSLHAHSPPIRCGRYLAAAAAPAIPGVINDLHGIRGNDSIARHAAHAEPARAQYASRAEIAASVPAARARISCVEISTRPLSSNTMRAVFGSSGSSPFSVTAVTSYLSPGRPPSCRSVPPMNSQGRSCPERTASASSSDAPPSLRV